MVNNENQKFVVFSSAPGKVNNHQDPTDVDQKKPLSCRNHEEIKVNQDEISNKSVNNPSARNQEIDQFSTPPSNEEIKSNHEEQGRDEDELPFANKKRLVPARLESAQRESESRKISPDKHLKQEQIIVEEKKQEPKSY